MSVTHWHHEPTAQAVLAKLAPEMVVRTKQLGIPADFYEYHPKTAQGSRLLAALGVLRELAVEGEAEGSFEQCETAGDASTYLAVDMRAPVLAEVIDEHFAPAAPARAAA